MCINVATEVHSIYLNLLLPILCELLCFSLIEILFFRAGMIYCEYYRIQQRLNFMISPFVVNSESRHPDYIYIKYHIYKETMQQKKDAELQSQVKFLTFDNVVFSYKTISCEKCVCTIFRNG